MSNRFKELVKQLADDATDRAFVISPVLCRETSDVPLMLVNFCGDDGFTTEAVLISDEADRADFTGEMACLALAGKHLHFMDTEEEMAERCHELWPCDATALMLEGMAP